MIKVKVKEADGIATIMSFKNKKALKNAISFDGQRFWLGSEMLGEVSANLQQNWDKLTDQVVSDYKDIYVRFLTEARAVTKLHQVI